MAGNRRDQVIDTAIELFTERGTRAVSTNHIAETAGISPGNLYYHFGSKEEIIRAIYERAIAEYDEFWVTAARVTPDPLTMLYLLDSIFSHQWKYRCLQRELPALVRQDSELADRYRKTQERRVAFYRFLCKHWMRTGSLRELPEEEIGDLAMATWLVGESWLGYLEAAGHGTEEAEVRRGARLIYTVLRPFLTDNAVNLIATSNWAS
jgi:AcrR family transcriptional regulator